METQIDSTNGNNNSQDEISLLDLFGFLNVGAEGHLSINPLKPINANNVFYQILITYTNNYWYNKIY